MRTQLLWSAQQFDVQLHSDRRDHGRVAGRTSELHRCAVLVLLLLTSDVAELRCANLTLNNASYGTVGCGEAGAASSATCLVECTDPGFFGQATYTCAMTVGDPSMAEWTGSLPLCAGESRTPTTP